jgi:hypothetical protein
VGGEELAPALIPTITTGWKKRREEKCSRADHLNQPRSIRWGDAVAARALRRAVKGVLAVPDGESNGRFVNRKLPATFHSDVNNESRPRWFVEWEIMVFLGGGSPPEDFQG